MQKNSFIRILIIILVLLTVCSQENEKKPIDKNHSGKESGHTQPAKETNDEHEDEEAEEASLVVDPLPSSFEELASLPVGELVDFSPDTNDPEKTLEAFKDLPDISTNPTLQEQDYFYRELLKKVQDDFIGPEELIRKLRFQAIGDPNLADTRYQFKENLNVEIILDASGSMAQSVGGKVKMATAKDAIMEFVKSLPEGAKVGLRVYGHKGSNADSDMQLSCSSSDVLYPISSKDENKFQSALNQIKPTGWTPTGLALKEAKRDLEKYSGENNTNIVYLVSDGVSTCNDNPIEAAKELYHSNISPIINVIGFDVDSKGQNELIQIADATEGIYQKVNDESELKKELNRISELADTWKSWKGKNTQEFNRKKTQNSIDIFSYTAREGYKATFEKTAIELIIFILKNHGKIDSEAYTYLNKINDEYHDWINSEVERFNAELKELNEKGYSEALKILEEKYQQNAN